LPFVLRDFVGTEEEIVVELDRLVARFDSKLDRPSNTFVILGLWLEDEALGQDEAFAAALAAGMRRFVAFLGADKLDATAIGEPLLRGSVETLQRH